MNELYLEVHINGNVNYIVYVGLHVLLIMNLITISGHRGLNSLDAGNGIERSVMIDRVPSYTVDKEHSHHAQHKSSVRFDDDGHVCYPNYYNRKVSRMG